MDFGDFTQSRHQLIILIVRNTAAFDEHRKMPFSFYAFHPSVTVAVMVKMIRFRLIQPPAEAVLQLGFYIFQTETVNSVLESGILSDGTISVITLNRNGFSATSYRLLRFAEADDF